MALYVFYAVALFALLAPYAAIGPDAPSVRRRSLVLGGYVAVLLLAVVTPAPFEFVARNLHLGPVRDLVIVGSVAGIAFVVLAVALRARARFGRS